MLQLGEIRGIGRGMQFRFYQGTGVKMIECRCPGCGVGHERMFYYTGHLPARIYCWDCYRAHFDLGRVDQRFVIDEEWEMKGF